MSFLPQFAQQAPSRENVCVRHSDVSNSLALPWTVARQASLTMGFSRQEYWSGLPFLSPGALPDPRIERRSPALQADSFHTQNPDVHPAQPL